MIKGYENKTKKRDDAIILCLTIIFILFVLWLILPPRDKVAQVGQIFSNARFLFNKDSRTMQQEVVYHRNQAVYYTRLKKNKAAIYQMNKAIEKATGFATVSEMEELYRDCAVMKVYMADHKGALNDYLKSGTPVSIKDNLVLAQLYKKNGNKRLAQSHCNTIISIDEKAYSGFACLADLYASVGRYDVAVKVYDIYLDRASNKAKGLADRAYYKSKLGDKQGAALDLQEAKEITSKVSEKITILDEALYPKTLNLPII